MGTTARGIGIGTDDPDVIADLDDFTDRLARIAPGVEEILPTAERFPDVAAVQLAAAMLWLYAQTDQASASARTRLEAAAPLEPGMDERERAQLRALRHWNENRFLAAAEAFEDLTSRWPCDLASIKALEFLYYLLGQQHCGPRFLAQMERLHDEHPPNRSDPDFLASFAFAAELSGEASRAEELAERSLAIQPEVPWAHHALAHVLITRGNRGDALDRLGAFLPSWERSGRVIHCHNAWHLGVAHLDVLDDAGARRLLHDHVWAVEPDSPNEQIDAISLLWRLEMGGWPVEESLWADVADHAEPRAGECFFPFLSAHHAYALARAGHDDALDTLLGVVRVRSAADDEEARRIWAPLGRLVVEASAAQGRGDLAGCARLLDPVITQVAAVGGSDAQDDLFRQAYLRALEGAGRSADARRWWSEITGWKTPSALEEAWRARL